MSDFKEEENTLKSQENPQQTPEPKTMLIGIKLTPKQEESIKNHNLDFEKIASLQKINTYPEVNKDIWKAGKNFDNSILVGFRKVGSDEHMVFLKVDGFFTTPEDITNCNPALDENGKPIFIDGKGYEFYDMTVAALKPIAKEGAIFASNVLDNINEFTKNATGGKSKKYKKRKLKSSKRVKKSNKRKSSKK